MSRIVRLPLFWITPKILCQSDALLQTETALLRLQTARSRFPTKNLRSSEPQPQRFMPPAHQPAQQHRQTPQSRLRSSSRHSPERSKTASKQNVCHTPLLYPPRLISTPYIVVVKLEPGLESKPQTERGESTRKGTLNNYV